MLFCFCGPQASWEYTREDDWCQHPGAESHLPWPPPNLITHAHFSIISTAASAPHSKPAWGLIGCKINPEGKEKDKVGGVFCLNSQTCHMQPVLLDGRVFPLRALFCLLSKGFAPYCHCLAPITILRHYADALLVCPARHGSSSISTPSPSKQSIYFKFFSTVEIGFHHHISFHCSACSLQMG